MKIFNVVLVYVIFSLLLQSCGGASLDSKNNESDSVCELGKNSSCNDIAEQSSIAGICQSDGACDCVDGFVVNPDTGKCMLPVCKFGADQSCNDDPKISSIHGVCLPEGICECQQGYDKNKVTGKCL